MNTGPGGNAFIMLPSIWSVPQDAVRVVDEVGLDRGDP